MTRRRTPLFATAALTVATAFAASTALAIAESNDSMSSQSVSSDARYPSNPGMNAPDQAADSQSLNSSSDTDEDAMDSSNSSSDADQDMDSTDDSDDSSDNITSPDVDSSGASSAGISSTQASSTTRLDSGSQIAEAPSDDATAVSGSTLVTRTRPVYIFPPDQPRYTPETGDAQYGSKLDPAGPSANRFNDATGQ